MRVFVFIPALLFILSLLTLSAVPVFGTEVKEANLGWYNRYFGNRGSYGQQTHYPQSNLIQRSARTSAGSPAMPHYGSRSDLSSYRSRFAAPRANRQSGGLPHTSSRINSIVRNSFIEHTKKRPEVASHHVEDSNHHASSSNRHTSNTHSSSLAAASLVDTSATVQTTASGTTSSGQTIVIQKDKESGMDMFMKFLPLIILILVIAIIIVLLYIFRDKLPACISACETCCEWTWIIIVWPFKMLWRGFKCVVYPLKEACFECCASCHDCCYPAQIKI